MNPGRLLLLSLVASTSLAPRPALAWHEIGHMSAALIAYRAVDDGAKKKMQEILKKHPHYGVFLKSEIPADAPLDEWVVMRASIWPDWVKNPHKLVTDTAASKKISSDFDRRDWHYVNLPIVVLDGADDDLRLKIEANSKKKNGQILDVLPVLLAGLKEPGGAKKLLTNKHDEPTLADDELRAIALCWVLHLVGDLHQPLHAVSFFSKDLPEGDRGGNAYIVHWRNSAVDLHSVWDGKFAWDSLRGDYGSQYGAVDGLLRERLDHVKLTGPQIAELKPAAWADESLKIAKEKAYRPGGERLPGHILKPHEQHPRAADLDPLPVGYATLVRRTAEQRVALAGQRLAGVLKNSLP
jgi:hypothetical protein